MDKHAYEPITATFYAALEEGRIMGRRCPRCGHIEFPPYICCNDCGNFETEWVDLTEVPAVATGLVQPSMMLGDPEFSKRYPGQYCFATVQVEGADEYNTCVLNIDSETLERKRLELPVPLKPIIVQHDGYKMIFWELAEE